MTNPLSSPPEPGHTPPDLLNRIEEMLDAKLAAFLSLLRPRPEGALLTPEEVAKRLGVSVRTLNRRIEAKDLRPLWVGGQRRFSPQAVADYERACSKERRTRSRGAARKSLK